jgi:hypothetical protein
MTRTPRWQPLRGAHSCPPLEPRADVARKSDAMKYCDGCDSLARNSSPEQRANGRGLDISFVEAYRLGSAGVGDGTVAGEGSVGACVTMIGEFGGPCPFPSCAAASVAAVEAMTRKVTTAHFIPALLRAQQGAAVAKSVSDPSATSPGDGSIENAPHYVSVAAGRLLSVPS